MEGNGQCDQQLFMYDVLTPVPQMWECRETCKHFGEHVDYPSWWNGEARCLLCTDGHTKSLIFDNRWFAWCDLYESKGGGER